MDIIIVLLGSVTLILLGSLIVARLLLPCEGVWLVVGATGDGGNLQQRLYGLMWLRGLGLLRCPIYVLCHNLTAEGELLTRHLKERWHSIILYQK
ncbi:MAG: hypothetical protein R3Y07_04180 [Eubacteriales bacterium]